MDGVGKMARTLEFFDACTWHVRTSYAFTRDMVVVVGRSVSSVLGYNGCEGIYYLFKTDGGVRC